MRDEGLQPVEPSIVARALTSEIRMHLVALVNNSPPQDEQERQASKMSLLQLHKHALKTLSSVGYKDDIDQLLKENARYYFLLPYQPIIEYGYSEEELERSRSSETEETKSNLRKIKEGLTPPDVASYFEKLPTPYNALLGNLHMLDSYLRLCSLQEGDLKMLLEGELERRFKRG